MAALFAATNAWAQSAIDNAAGLPINPSLGAAAAASRSPSAANSKAGGSQGAGQPASANEDASMVSAPSFRAGASAHAEEAYVSNSAGSAVGAQADYTTLLGLDAYVREQTRRFTLSANYDFNSYFYASGRVPTQLANYLQATSTLVAIPEYLTFSAKAFAQPVLESNLGILTSNNRIVPNGYSNSYGYYVGPQFHFRLSDFAVSDSMASYGGVYFEGAQGSTNPLVLPGVFGPQDMISRTLTEQLSSGSDFARFTWSLTGVLNETAEAHRLLSETAGVGNFSYTILSHISLLATLGYDHVKYPTEKISAPIWMGGIGASLGSDLNFKFEAGRKYHSNSYYANLRYNITPSLLLTGSADDYITTPEGLLLNSLTNLTASPLGDLGPSQSLLQNGSFAAGSSFNAQNQGLTFDQSLSRYQVGDLSLAGDFERNHASISAFVMRRTILSGANSVFPNQDYLGSTVSYSRDISRLLRSSIYATYSIDKEFGGSANVYDLGGRLDYSLSPLTSVYFQAYYLHRSPTARIQSLSPAAGSLSDAFVSLGISHTLF